MGFSLVVVRGLLSGCGEGAALWLRCTGFSLQWLLLLQSVGSRHMGFSTGSVVVAPGLYSTGLIVVARELVVLWLVGSS